MFNLYRTVVEKGTDLVPTGTKELFIVPEVFSLQSVQEVLSFIRNQTCGYWYRMERKVMSVDTFTKNDPAFELKYVVVEDDFKNKFIFLFSKSVNHDCFYQVTQLLEHTDTGEVGYLRCVSAGFTDLKTCYGRSESLNISSNPEDTKLLGQI